MHRTTDPDTVTIGALPKQHINQSLPSIPGTALDGEFANAVQEEIINVIEEAGLSIETVPATDRSNGFTQLKEALFDSEALDTTALVDGAVTDAKVTSVGLDKLIYGVMSILEDSYTLSLQKNRFKISHETPSETYPIEATEITEEHLQVRTEDPSGLYTTSLLTDTDLTISDTTDAVYDVYEVFLDITRIEMNREKADGSTDLSINISPTSGYYHGISGTSETVYNARLNYTGLTFNGSGKSIKHRVIVVPLTSWTGSGPYSKTVVTSLPTSVDILSANLTYKNTATGVVVTHPNTVGFETVGIVFNPAAELLEAAVSVDFDPTSGWEAMFLTIWYAD